jgi:hypothetical protein
MLLKLHACRFHYGMGWMLKITRSVRAIDVPILKEFNISRSLRLLLLDELKIGSSYLAYEPTILSLFDKTILHRCSACLSGNQNWIEEQELKIV